MQKNYFQSLNIVWLAITSAPIIVLIVLTVIAQGSAPQADLKGLFDYLAAGLVVSMVFGSSMVYTQMLNQHKNGDLAKKMQGFRTATIVKGAMLEGSSLFCAIAYFLTQTIWLLPIPLAIFLLMLMQRPTRERFTNEMEVSASDISDLQ
jgi:hypothetical protein